MMEADSGTFVARLSVFASSVQRPQSFQSHCQRSPVPLAQRANGRAFLRIWTVLKTWSIASISDSIRLDGFGAKACGDSQGFSISMIG